MPKFEKGRQKTGGRQAGTPNKSAEMREFISLLLREQKEKIRHELPKLEGKEYFAVIKDLLEYDLPKLQRIELKSDDVALTHQIIIRKPDN